MIDSMKTFHWQRLTSAKHLRVDRLKGERKRRHNQLRNIMAYLGILMTVLHESIYILHVIFNILTIIFKRLLQQLETGHYGESVMQSFSDTIFTTNTSSIETIAKAAESFFYSLSNSARHLEKLTDSVHDSVILNIDSRPPSSIEQVALSTMTFLSRASVFSLDLVANGFSNLKFIIFSNLGWKLKLFKVSSSLFEAVGNIGSSVVNHMYEGINNRISYHILGNAWSMLNICKEQTYFFYRPLTFTIRPRVSKWTYWAESHNLNKI